MYWKNEALAPLPAGNTFLSEGIPVNQVILEKLYCTRAESDRAIFIKMDHFCILYLASKN